MPKQTEQIKQDISQTGVLLVNTGTPDAPTKQAIKRYLADFLSDRHIVNLPPLLWKPILHGIVLNTRPNKTARIYRSVWTEQGSPYTIYSQQIEQRLQEVFLGGEGQGGGQRDGRGEGQGDGQGGGQFAQGGSSNGHPAHLIKMAHRYGNPSIETVLKQFKQQGIAQLIVLPLYPQQAFSTTSSVFCELKRVQAALDYHPKVKIIENYHDSPQYIESLANHLLAYLDNTTTSNPHVLFSYHSVPLKDLRHGDQYYNQVIATTKLLAERLQLPADSYSMVFQSRFEDAQRWQGPFLPDRLKELLSAGTRNFAVVAPIFAVDCVETLYDIDIKARKELFSHAKGQGILANQLQFSYLPSLNSSDAQIQLLQTLITGQG